MDYLFKPEYGILTLSLPTLPDSTVIFNPKLSPINLLNDSVFS